AADIADHVTLAHALAGTDTFCVTVKMCIQGGVALAVLQDDRATVSALVAGMDNLAITRRLDRRATRSGVIDTFVRAHLVQHGMVTTGAEPRADTRKGNR